MKLSCRRISILLFFFILAGCAQIPEHTQTIPWNTLQTKLDKLTSWSFKGKIAMITDEDRISANVYWEQNDQDFHILLTTFMGKTIFDISKNDDIVKITNEKNESFYGTDPNQLLKELYDINIPITRLQNWIKGKPSKASFVLNKQDLLSSLIGFDQKGQKWEMDFSEYNFSKKFPLPKKFELSHKNVKLKFAIYDWDLKESEKTNEK